MKAKMLRFYVSNTDVVDHQSVYETIAHTAKQYGLAGATVYRAVMGYGASSNLRSDKFWELNTKVPMMIEIIDEENKIEGFLAKIKPWLEEMPKGCIVTMQDIDILLQKSGKNKS
jgi:PII-like signaling protein